MVAFKDFELGQMFQRELSINYPAPSHKASVVVTTGACADQENDADDDDDENDDCDE